MKLGAFSVSLNVKDIQASKAFYQALGFSEFAGEIEQKWLIMQNPDGHTIGLFEGMLPSNTLTFNPGWQQNAQNTDEFDDVRAIQQQLQDAGIELDVTTDAQGNGPASIMLRDPDGNQILIDQHR